MTKARDVSRKRNIMTNYRTSQEVQSGKKKSDAEDMQRINRIVRLGKARQAGDFEAMLDIAAEYEWRGGYGDADRARKIRKEVKGMRENKCGE